MVSMNERGSIELVVLGLLAALVVVLAIPMLNGVYGTPASLSRPTVPESD
jgi:hypothetical protein